MVTCHLRAQQMRALWLEQTTLNKHSLYARVVA